MLVEAPAVVIAGRDAEIVSFMLDDLLRRDYFNGLRPEDRARVERLAAEVAVVARNSARRGQAVDRRGADGNAALVNYGGAAQRLDVSERTVRRLVASGRLPVVCIDGARRIRVTDLDAFVEENR